MRPPIFLFDLARKERQRRARCKKEKSAKQGPIRFCASPFAEWLRFARAAAWVVNRRAAASCVVHSLSEVSGSGSGMRAQQPRETAIAATYVLHLGSPLLRGVQRTLPLVAFLWSLRTISFREQERNGSYFTQRNDYCSLTRSCAILYSKWLKNTGLFVNLHKNSFSRLETVDKKPCLNIMNLN